MKDGAGFTLPEVLITIVILGIMLSIATSSWFGLVDSRRVTSATNQFASDLRLAHTKSTNQLKEYAVVTDLGSLGLPAGTADYYIVEIPSSVVTARELDEDDRVEIDVPFGARFKPDGSAATVGDLAKATTISLQDGGAANNPKHAVRFNTETSRVKID